jgi:hypothetical protein
VICFLSSESHSYGVVDIFDLSKHVSDDAPSQFALTLKDNLHVTQSLVTKFVQLGGQKQSSLLHEESYIKCQKAQNEVSWQFRRYVVLA